MLAVLGAHPHYAGLYPCLYVDVQAANVLSQARIKIKFHLVIAAEISATRNVLFVPLGERKQPRVTISYAVAQQRGKILLWKHRDLNCKLRDSLRVLCIVGAKIESSGICVNIQNQI